jgi:hypothetical protein
VANGLVLPGERITGGSFSFKKNDTFTSMSTIAKNTKRGKPGKPVRKKKTGISDMRDFSNDPFFVKKTEDAKKLVAKYGTPKF